VKKVERILNLEERGHFFGAGAAFANPTRGKDVLYEKGVSRDKKG